MNKLVISANNILLQYYEKIKPSQKEQNSRLNWINLLKKEILKIYPSASIDLFGSFYTGLYVHSSDIDISLNIKTSDPNSILKNLKLKLKQTNLVHSLLHLSHAKIPILKFKCKKYGFKFDFSVNNSSGIKAGNFIKLKLEEDPNIGIFVILFKQFINSRKLGDASMGGLNSYSQFLMIINFLDLNPFYQKGNLAVTFFDFIQYYGYDFKYKNIQINAKNIVYRDNMTKRLSIIDPTDESVDVGACCKKFEKILEILQNFYRIILYHFNNQTIEELFEEMFYLDEEELEQRRFVVENCNKKIFKEKNKTKMGLRDANFNCKNMELQQKRKMKQDDKKEEKSRKSKDKKRIEIGKELKNEIDDKKPKKTKKLKDKNNKRNKLEFKDDKIIEFDCEDEQNISVKNTKKDKSNKAEKKNTKISNKEEIDLSNLVIENNNRKLKNKKIKKTKDQKNNIEINNKEDTNQKNNIEQNNKEDTVASNLVVESINRKKKIKKDKRNNKIKLKNITEGIKMNFKEDTDLFDKFVDELTIENNNISRKKKKNLKR
ncbi:poly(A) RNA polymerase protein (PAPD5) [Vairimorpha necatrix]|uniref:Poly(A) RNA polymerase protein (PAPD5) n=1 Tax=Vairimorpha necatrix TaxID=6039 RepID=A0AAX4JBU0_9MICR